VSDYALDTLILTVLWAGLGGAWNLFCGYVRKDSIGHAAFFGVGAYTSTLLLLRLGISPWLGMLAGAALAAAAALVIGAITLRLRGPFFTLATIAFAEVLRTLAVGLRGLTEGSVGLTIHTATGLRLMRFDAKAAYLLVALGLLALVLAVTYWQSRSRFGYLLRAMGEDEEVAGALGVNTLPLKLGSLGLSAALTGMLGTFYAQYITFIDPDSAFNIFDSIQMALVAIIGGVGTLLGPVLGALLMVPLGVWLRGLLGSQMAGLHLVIYAVILIVAALFMPRGIMGTLEARGPRLRARKAALAAGPEPR
jgi:branched-chain amino acid transport system permease protein